MGSVSEIVNRIFIIINFVFILISLQSSHVLIASEGLLDAADDYFKVHGLQDLFDNYQNQVQKVSGEDENEEKEGLIVQKFRALLGLKSFKAESSSSDGSEHLSPAPSPSPKFEAEAPAPEKPFYVPAHHHPRRSYPVPQHHKIHKENTNKGRVGRILLPVLVSTGSVFVVCVLGFIWVCCNRKHHKKSGRTMSVFRKNGRSKGKSKYVSSQKSTSKVNLNPGLDLFYLNSLGVDLEQQASCLKPSNENVNASSNHSSTQNYALHERDISNQEVIKSESDNASSSSTREITSVHEDVDVADSIKYESDGGESSYGDKIIPIECHSSDEESFHSFNDSHSSNYRLSNASAVSLGDMPENFSSKPAINLQNGIHQTLSNHKERNLAVADSTDPHKNFGTLPAPPPPPPPPPPRPLQPSVSYAYSNSSSCPAKFAPKASSSSLLPNLSSPSNSESSSESNQTPQSASLSPQETSKSTPTLPGIPPPPCPPPFLKQNKNSLKGPPPPPSLLPQHTPLGKDGALLPKLKPLHWDKVRAAPDRSMVWDKLRSSSFE